MQIKKKLKKIKNIAVINLGYVGDVVNASCITIELKKSYPDSKITFITVPKSEEMAKYLPGVEEVIVFDKDIQHKGIKMLPLIFKLRLKYKFDMAVLLNETFRSGLFAFLMGAKYKVGHNSEGRGMFLTHTVQWPQEEKDFKVHISEIYMRNLKAIGLYNLDYKFGLTTSEEDSVYIKKLLIENGYDNQELIGLCPCARLSCKDWKPEEAAKFIDYINSNPNKKVVIIGQDNARVFSEKLRELGVNNFIDLSNKTNIPQLIELIKTFKVFVSVDSAPMHIGAVLGVSMLGLFVGDNFGKWWPGDNEKRKLVYDKGLLKAENVIKSFEELGF